MEAPLVAGWDRDIIGASRRFRIPEAVLKGLIDIESSGNPNAVSSAGARGLTQFMPATARSYGVRFGSSRGAVRSQIYGAARYLADLGYAKNPRKALASYNAGPGNYKAGLGYAQNVLSKARQHGSLSAPNAPGGDSGGQDTLSVLLRQSTGQQPLQPPDFTAVNLLAQGLQKPSPPPLGALPQPSFSAQAPMPQGAQPLPSAGPPVPQGPSLDDQLQAVAQIQGQVPVQPEQSLSAIVRNGGEAPVKGGKVEVASNANRAGVGIKPVVMDYLSHVAGRAHGAITVGTGTRHNRLTVDGNVSDHWDGHAADIPVPVDSHRGDVIATAALETAGVPASRARAMARRGGLFTINHGGHRIQVIWKTNAGGNHHNHVHIGIR
jgi:hypothetical protein